MGLAKSSFLFSSGTLISRLTGLLRDRIVLSVFGASDLHDAFLIAYKIPNLLRDMLAEGALGNSFTKVYSAICAQDEKRGSNLFIDSLYLMSLIATIVCLIGIVGAPWLVKLVTIMAHASERGPDFFINATGLTRILFPFLGFMILASVTMGALHQRGRFFLTGISPVALNLGTIVGALWFSNLLEAYGPAWMETFFADRALTGLAIGVLLGGFLQFFIQLWGLWRPVIKGNLYLPRRLPWSEDTKKVFILMAPMVVAASAAQVKIVINLIFAASLQEGAVTWLNYSFRLLQLPIGLFGVAVGAAVLPSLARSIANAGGKVDRASARELQNGVDMMLWVMVPCLSFFLYNSLPTVRLLYQSGAFSDQDAVACANALYGYSFGLVGYGLIKVLTSFYFAVDRTTYAMKISIVSIVINLGANYIFMAKWGHVGLAMALSATLIFNALLLVLGLIPEKLDIAWSNLLRSLGILTAAFGLSLLLQSLCQPFIAGLDLKPSTPVWMSSSIVLGFNSVLIVGVFFVLGLFRLRLTPKKAWWVIRLRLGR